MDPAEVLGLVSLGLLVTLVYRGRQLAKAERQLAEARRINWEATRQREALLRRIEGNQVPLRHVLNGVRESVHELTAREDGLAMLEQRPDLVRRLREVDDYLEQMVEVLHGPLPRTGYGSELMRPEAARALYARLERQLDRA